MRLKSSQAVTHQVEFRDKKDIITVQKQQIVKAFSPYNLLFYY